MAYDPGKHRRRSIRLKNYNYSKKGYYFITLCSKNRECLFARTGNAEGLSKFADTQFMLTDIGAIIEKNWNRIFNEHDHVFPDEYVIMPNHVHGIILIDRPAFERPLIARGRSAAVDQGGPVINQGGRRPARATARVAPTLGSIVGGFKSRCVLDNLKRIRQNGLNETAGLWQKNYYERIIRNDHELNNIRKYIIENPRSWDNDENHPNHLQNRLKRASS